MHEGEIYLITSEWRGFDTHGRKTGKTKSFKFEFIQDQISHVIGSQNNKLFTRFQKI